MARWRAEFLYEGADGLDRAVAIEFSPAPVARQEGKARFVIELEPRQSRQISVSISISEIPRATGHKIDVVERAAKDSISSDGEIASPHRKTQLNTDSLLLNRVMDRSLRDLDVLRSQLAGVHYFAAGIPWFVALFGREHHHCVADSRLRSGDRCADVALGQRAIKAGKSTHGARRSLAKSCMSSGRVSWTRRGAAHTVFWDD